MLFLQLVILLLFISAFAVVGLQTNEYRTQLFRQLSKEDKSNIFYTFYSEELRKNDDVIISELRSSPLVADVIPNEDMADEGVMYFYDNDGIDIPNFYGKEIGHTRVHPGFFEFFQCELVEGKFFTENSSPRDVVVDENFASYYKDKSPVGESFNGYKIVGVIKNLNTYKKKHEDFHADKFPMFYSVMSAKVRSSLLYVKSQKGKTQEVRQLFDKTVKRFLPPQDRNATVIHPFDKALEWSVEEEKILLRSMRVLFIISLFICLLGIYSAIVTNTEKRRKEIAIRKINGATVKDIIVLFGKTYVVLWTAACILFFPAVYYLADKWLANYVVRISLDIGFFAGIYITVMTLVFLTIIFQILRVAKCNPAEVIKKE
ncbi:MAG: ABC transporter permease [Prevotellaceae bacterium]|jgi:ABC-type antimicrobial peptide transport system permease subunit|nr:ABC transporter permease [Prevotellaceae bacterium]